MPKVPDRSAELLDPEKYFQNRFQELFENPFNEESKPAKRYIELLQKIPALKGKEDCLDLGCGAGIGTWLIGKSARYALGIDSTESAIRFANQHYRQEGKIEFLIGDILNLQLSGKFDRVFLVHTLEHLPPHLCPVLLSKIFDLLRAGGMLHLSVPTEASLIYRFERLMEWLKNIPPWDPTHLSKFTVPRLLRLSKKPGFKVFQIERRLFPSRKLNTLHQKISFPAWLQNSLTEELFLTLVKN